MGKIEKRLAIALSAGAGVCLLFLLNIQFEWGFLFLPVGMMLLAVAIWVGVVWPALNYMDWLLKRRAPETSEPLAKADHIYGAIACLLLMGIAGCSVYGGLLGARNIQGRMNRARVTRAAEEMRDCELALTAMLTDSKVNDFRQFFLDVDAAAEAYGGEQELWNTALPDLMRKGRAAQIEHGNPDILQRLGTSYNRELGADPWGNPYQFYVPAKGGTLVYIWSMGPDGVSSWSPATNGATVPVFGGDDLTR